MSHIAAPPPPTRQSVDAEHRKTELEAEAGEAVGAMPPDAPDAPAPVDPDEIVVDGTSQLSMFDLGGKQASRATIKFTGGKVGLVAGEAYRKGDRIRFSGEAVVNSVGQKDEHDPKTSQVVDCEQRHEARIVDLQVESASS
jgi:hypothetical protein